METWAISNTAAPKPRSLFMALEPRLMLDADPAVALAESTAATPDTNNAEAAPAAAEPSRKEVVFVFSNVESWQDIAAAAPSGAELVVVDPEEDGLARMAQELQGRQDIDAIHVVSHGEDGEISLGAAILDISTVSSLAAELATIGAALAEGGDLLFYGCESGKAEAGATLAQAVAEATGADVALSSDATGAASLGGDWELETQAGTVESAALSAPEWGSLLAVEITRASLTDGDVESGTDVSANAIFTSSDGRYVVFTSTANDLTGAGNGLSQVYLRNTRLGVETTTLVSHAVAGLNVVGNGHSVVTDMSDDGRYIVFESTANNLLGDLNNDSVPDDTNNRKDVFVYDSQTHAITRVSLGAGGQITMHDSFGGTISRDGTLVSFMTTRQAAGGDGDALVDVFVRDTGAGTTTFVSSSAVGAVTEAQISGNGGKVAYVAGGTVWLHTLGGGTSQVATNASRISISYDGNQIAFQTTDALKAGDTQAHEDVYLADMSGGAPVYTLVSPDAGSASTNPVISGGGDYVAYLSGSNAFLWEKSSGRTFSVHPANNATDQIGIGSDGGHVAFRSTASFGGNAFADIYVATGMVVTPAQLGATPHFVQPQPPPMLPLGESAAGETLRIAEGGDHPMLAADMAGGDGGLQLGGLAPLGGTGDLGGQALPPPPPPPGMFPPPLPGFGPPPPRPGDLGGLRGGIATQWGGAGLWGGQWGGDGFGPFGRGFRPFPPGFDPRMEHPSLPEVAKALGQSDDATAQVTAQLISGGDVSLSDAKQALEQSGASPEVVRTHMAVIQQAVKAQRTEKLAGALGELSQNPAAADSFTKEAASDNPLKDIQITGNRVAVVIGVENYNGVLPDLKTPGNDVAKVSATLAERFGYQTIVAKDATKAEMVNLIKSVGDRLDQNGSLVVYYAGHGYAVEATGQGYWLPSDARADNAANWISTADLSGYLGQVKASQIMVVSDSCYSGAMTREARMSADSMEVSRDSLTQRRAVTALSSGGDEPVADGGGEGHSVFAAKLLKTLESADAGKLGVEIFGQVRNDVARELPQVPTYGGLTSAGHAGGTDFVIGGR